MWILPLLVRQLISLRLAEFTIAQFRIASFLQLSKLWTQILSGDLQILLCLPRPDIAMAAHWFFVLAPCPLLEHTYLDLVRWLLGLLRKRKFAFELSLLCLEIGKAFGAKRREKVEPVPKLNNQIGYPIRIQVFNSDPELVQYTNWYPDIRNTV